jgi:iron complex outermembrane receptor protein
VDVSIFLPEEVTNYELGIKSHLFDDRVNLNSAFFYEDYKNLQVTQLGPTVGSGQVTENAAAASIYGVEIEGQWMITPNDHLSGFLSYLRATYDDYKSAVDQQTGTVYPDLSGNSLSHAPRTSGKLQYSHDFSLSNGGTLTPMVAVYYQTSTYLREFNLPVDRVGGYTKTNFNLRYLGVNGHWRAEVYGGNLEDKAVRNSGFTLIGRYFSDYNPPRTFGGRLVYEY